MNTGNIIGRLTRDMESVQTKEGKTIAKGSIAVSDRFDKDRTHFFNFTAFGKTAEIMIKYLSKGSQIGLTYSLSQNRWENKEGQKRSTIELIVNEFTFTGSKGESSAVPADAPPLVPDEFIDNSEAPF
jgi:single-strand DNA-binding protein